MSCCDAFPDFLLDAKPHPLLYSSPENIQKVPPKQNFIYTLNELETVLSVQPDTLTPPQSPPYATTLTTLEPAPIPVANQHEIIYETYNDSESNDTDVAYELAVVDELVRTRVESLVPSSPSSFGDYSSDPEWSEGDRRANKSPKQKKYYSRNVEEKVSRKKEQNKNAATRYRMKKKAEIEEILEEEKGLVTKNGELESKVGDLQREIKYLKNLMREVFKAKGML
jgi:cyclic AMP-dependent transcription factor ATF-4